MATTLQRQSDVHAGGIINFLAGIWLILAPFILAYSSVRSALWNDIILGALILVFAAVGMSANNISWSRWLNLLFGIWVFFAPFILSYSATGRALWNDIILGLIVVIMSLFGSRSMYGSQNMAS